MQHETAVRQPVAQTNAASAPATMIWLEAIAGWRCVDTVYNGVRTRIAPHVLYLRAGQPYVAAAVLERRGVAVSEPQLKVFAVAGLRDSHLTRQGFQSDPAYSALDPRWVDDSVFAVSGVDAAR